MGIQLLHCCVISYMYLVVQNVELALNRGNDKLQQGFWTCMIIKTFFHKLCQWYLYSSVRIFVIADTDENGENCYMTNNNQFAVYSHG